MVAKPVSTRLTREKKALYPESVISYYLDIMCGKNCLVNEGGSDNVPPPPPTKSFGYNKCYVYGSGREVEQWNGFELEFVSVEEMVSYVINDIHTTYENHKDSSKDGYALQAVVVFIMNKNSFVENDEPPETVSSQITLYHINREKTTVINHELIESTCDDVFYDEVFLVSSDED